MKVFVLCDTNGHFRAVDVSTPEKREKVFRGMLESLMDRDQQRGRARNQALAALLAKKNLPEKEVRAFLGEYTQISFCRAGLEEVEVETSWSDEMTETFY